MGQIMDTAGIGGSGHGKIWDTNNIGGELPPSLSLDQYTTSAGTSEAHTFSLSTDGSIKTVWDGAKVQIVTPADAVAPVTYTSSAPDVAAIDSSGLVTWHNSGSVTFTVSDSAGSSGRVTFNPGLLAILSGSGHNHADAVAWAESVGARLGMTDELTSGTGVRAVGSIYGEWGNYFSSGWSWTGESSGSGHYSVDMASGRAGGSSDGNLDINTIGIILVSP